ncbi:hypothetical protein DSO57_1038676, partial [Entomophthora muscae]
PIPTSSPNLSTDYTGKLFGIVYIIFTGVIDTIITAIGLWSWVGKLFSYIFRLAPLLWWALPAKNLAQMIPKTDRLAAQDWIPDIMAIYCQGSGCTSILTIAITPNIQSLPNLVPFQYTI